MIQNASEDSASPRSFRDEDSVALRTSQMCGEVVTGRTCISMLLGCWSIIIFALKSIIGPTLLGAWAAIFAAVLAYLVFSARPMFDTKPSSTGSLNLHDILKSPNQSALSWWAVAVLLATPAYLVPLSSHSNAWYFTLAAAALAGLVCVLHLSSQSRAYASFAKTLVCTLVGSAVYQLWEMQQAFDWAQVSMLLLSLVALHLVLDRVGTSVHHTTVTLTRLLLENSKLGDQLVAEARSAQEARATKDNLLANAAHDLRQPVHALAFYADWLRNEPELAESIVPKILTATDSVNALFNSLFDFAKIESGAVTACLQSVPLSPLLDDMIIQFSPAAQTKGLNLRVVGGEFLVHSDPVLLRRVVANLLGNAIRYTESGEVTLKTRALAGSVQLEVIDTGLGIPEEHLPHVFNAFYRTQQHAGTADSFGLGLAIVERLCRTLGHSVEIRSRAGLGTVCRLDMPFANRQAETESTRSV